MRLDNSKLIYTMVFLSWKSFFLIVLLCSCVTIILANNISTSQASCHANERSALLQFKDSFFLDCSFSNLPNAYPKMKSWAGHLHGDCCSWDGVQCNERGHVIGLNLGSSCINGNFPSNSSLFSLTHLQQLKLSGNFFYYSPIPSEIGKLSKLRSLELSTSLFSGQIPSEISRLSELSVLDLSDNSDGSHGLQLHDPNFEELVRTLTRLQVLFLDAVDISSPIPKVLSNLTSLQVISLAYCQLTGQLPTSIFHLARLDTLTLTGNINLVGSLPEFQQNSPLFSLYIDETKISGDIPPSIGNLAHLEKFSIRTCQFSGTIPSSLGNLTKLKILEISENYFSGNVPYSLANLTQLTILDISKVSARPDMLFSWLSKLNKLAHLELRAMNLTGEIPSFFVNFTSLVKLDLTSNNLTGQIPDWLMNLTQLEKLMLSDNQLKGPISQRISQLANLSVLQLSENDNLYANFDAFFKLKNLLGLELSGIRLTFSSNYSANESLPKLDELDLNNCNLTEFPQFLRNQDSLETLVLSENNIHGLIPKWLVNITRKSLYYLDLSNNLLTGFEDPTAVPPWTRIKFLILEGNRLQGSLPVPSVSTAVYQVSNNQFAGHIPQGVCHASTLKNFDVSNNDLVGQIPECISELGRSLVVLDLQGNNFQGTIPYSYPKSCKLKMINLSQNQLEGNVPRSLTNCIMLEALDIGNNQINDTFPSWLGSLPNLQILVLRHNHFYGKLGRQNATNGFQSLHIIDISHNFHTGDLPSHYFQKWQAMKTVREDQSRPSSTTIVLEFFDGAGYYWWLDPYVYSITITNKGSDLVYTKVLEVFRVVDFSSNNFTGRIPDSVGECRGLQALNLSNNNLDGGIPSSLANIRDLESFDLSVNMLSGEIPQQLTQLTSLEVFNVSHNLLVGPIPQGWQFNAFDNSSFDGNLDLCGSPLSKKCGIKDNPPPIAQPENEKEDDSKVDWIVRSFGCAGGFVVGCAIGKYITDRNHEWFIMTFAKKRRPRTKVRRTAHRRS